MNNILPDFLRNTEPEIYSPVISKHARLPFIDLTLKTIVSFIKSGYVQSQTALKNGFMQRLDPCIKLAFLLFFIIIINLGSHIITQALVAVFLVLIYSLSKLNVIEVFKRITVLGIMFGVLVVLPACLNLVTPGKNIFTIIHFSGIHKFWIYSLPEKIFITQEGCMVVIRFYLKVSNSIALTLLIVYTTPFNEIIRSLKIIRVPDVLLLIITLGYKFIFILTQTTEETYLALKARWWIFTSRNETNKLIAGRITYIFRKSWIKYEEIYKAMIIRGFTGKIKVLSFPKIGRMDITFSIIFILWGIICCIF